MNGKVTVWQMTEEQRLEYVKKHPIIPRKKPSGSSYAATDYKWRSEKAIKARWGDGDSE